MAAGDDQPAQLREALGPQQRHVDGVRDGPEVDRVAGPVVALLAAAVRGLLEEGDPEAVLACDRLGDAEQQRRVLVRVARVVARGDEAARAAAARHVHAERLRAADDDVRAVVGRRREDAERERVDADDRLGAVAARERGDLGGARLDAAEERGVLEEHGRGARREPSLEIVEVDAARRRVVADELDLDLARQLGSAAVGADHREALRADRVGHEHVQAPGQAGGHPDGVAGRAAPAVDGQADEVHPDQLAELARELEPGLVAAVVGRRRAPDRRQELAARARSRRRPPARGAARCRRRGS